MFLKTPATTIVSSSAVHPASTRIESQVSSDPQAENFCLSDPLFAFLWEQAQLSNSHPQARFVVDVDHPTTISAAKQPKHRDSKISLEDGFLTSSDSASSTSLRSYFVNPIAGHFPPSGMVAEQHKRQYHAMNTPGCEDTSSWDGSDYIIYPSGSSDQVESPLSAGGNASPTSSGGGAISEEDEAVALNLLSLRNPSTDDDAEMHQEGVHNRDFAWSVPAHIVEETSLTESERITIMDLLATSAFPKPYARPSRYSTTHSTKSGGITSTASLSSNSSTSLNQGSKSQSFASKLRTSRARGAQGEVGATKTSGMDSKSRYQVQRARQQIRLQERRQMETEEEAAARRAKQTMYKRLQRQRQRELAGKEKTGKVN